MTRQRPVAVVTGASAGVGRAIAVAFGEAGWSVALLARSPDGLASTRHEVEDAGGDALAIVTDMSDPDAVEAAAQRIEEELGPIGVWVNNAMVTVYAPSVEVTPAEWEQVTRVTYLGQVFGTLAALKRMRARDRGHVIFVGSALAYRSIPFQAPYCAAKAAVRGFVDALRSELGSEGSAVALSMLQLPAVNTPQFDWARNKLGLQLAPVPPIYEPETIADAVLRAVRERPREYWIGFSAVKAIMAQMLAPAVADRVLARRGVSSETTGEPAVEPRPDNLFRAGRGDPGARGRFAAQSRPHAVAFNPEVLRAAAGIAALAVAGGLVAGLLGARRRDGASRLPPDAMRRRLRA